MVQGSLEVESLGFDDLRFRIAGSDMKLAQGQESLD